VGRLTDRPLNNAQLVGVLIYRTHLDWFQRWYQENQDDIARAVAKLRTLEEGATGDAAFQRLDRALAAGAGPGS